MFVPVLCPYIGMLRCVLHVCAINKPNACSGEGYDSSPKIIRQNRGHPSSASVRRRLVRNPLPPCNVVGLAMRTIMRQRHEIRLQSHVESYHMCSALERGIQEDGD